jgi:hypothetical protein
VLATIGFVFTSAYAFTESIFILPAALAYNLGLLILMVSSSKLAILFTFAYSVYYITDGLPELGLVGCAVWIAVSIFLPEFV